MKVNSKEIKGIMEIFLRLKVEPEKLKSKLETPPTEPKQINTKARQEYNEH